MFVNDIQKIRNLGMPPQFQALWVWVKQSRVVRTVLTPLNSVISLREDDGFCNNSNVADTHNSNTQEGLKAMYVYVINKNYNSNRKEDGTFLHGASPRGFLCLE